MHKRRNRRLLAGRGGTAPSVATCGGLLAVGTELHGVAAVRVVGSGTRELALSAAAPLFVATVDTTVLQLLTSSPPDLAAFNAICQEFSSCVACAVYFGRVPMW